MTHHNIFQANLLVNALVLVLLSSCCDLQDSKVAKGYPYGDEQELNFSKLPFPVASEGNNFPLHFPNKDSCQIYINSTYFQCNCNCDGLDLEKNDLVHVSGYIFELDEANIQPRVLINHKTKTYTIELRGYKKYCGGYNRDIVVYNQWLLIPKLPEGYIFIRKNIAPVLPAL